VRGIGHALRQPLMPQDVTILGDPRWSILL
jgi:hypothetical protein